MNTALAKKILEKLTLKELYDEIRNSDQMIYNLGMIFAAKKKALFCRLIRDLVEAAIKEKDSTDLTEFLRQEIIEMDGPDGLSLNELGKKKVASGKDDDPCSRGSSYGRSSC